MTETQRVQTDIESMNFRVPVLEDPSTAELARHPYGLEAGRQTANHEETQAMDRRWSIVTEVARRAILAGSQVGPLAEQFIPSQLEEQIPGRFMHGAAATDETVSKAVAIAGTTLKDHLDLPSVPDQLMPKDISSSPKHHDKEEAAKKLAYDLERYPEIYDRSVKEWKEWAEVPGITQREKNLVARRYRYGRDVKLLGLIAEMQSKPPEFHADGDTLRAELPSGIKLGIAKDAYEGDSAILDPREWKNRRQIKDRVFEVKIGDKAYILKEKKTNRHTDTTNIKGSSEHEEGLSSSEEYEVGRKMAATGARAQHGVELEWEGPVAYAEFPDGYQFCLFNKIEDLTPRSGKLEDDFSRIIRNAPEAYAADYEHVKAAAAALYAERAKALAESRPGFQPYFTELTYEDYAEAKANAMVCLAESFVKEAAFDAGFWNRDHDRIVDFGMKIIPSEDGMHMLRANGFDYEYFKKGVDIVEGKKNEYEDRKKSGWLMKSGAIDGSVTPSIQQAAEYAIMREYGWAVPPLGI